MCHLIELHGGVADGLLIELHEETPLHLVAWHEMHEGSDEFVSCPPQCEGTFLIDPANPEHGTPPGDAVITTYRRRYKGTLLAAASMFGPVSVVPVPYDVVTAPHDSHVTV